MKAEHGRQLAVFGAVAVLFCVAGGVAIVFGLGMYRENRAFADGATAAEGKVVGFETWESGTGFNERENIHYAVVVYKTADGREVRFRGPSKDGLVKLKQGDAVRVLYYPANPQAARVDSFMDLWFGATMLIAVGTGAVLVPLLTMWQAWKWASRQGGAEKGNGQ